MAISDKDFYASHGISFDIEEMQIEYTKRVINQAKIEVLTELQLEIEEKSIIDYDEDLYDGGECVISISEINEIIQQKINSLKEA